MNFRILFLLIAFSFNTASADFSESQMEFHPFNVATTNEPFIVEVKGEWPTDCHPGEQKPVISEYTGGSVLIEFETIIEHVTCNKVVTPYRVLVDMSDVIGTVEGHFSFVNVAIRFDGHELMRQLHGPCILMTCPADPDVKPEPGLYYSAKLEQQGLLLARQNQRMVTDVLSYDESGSSEWLYGAGGIAGDVFFADLFESKGGQCLDCPESAEPPQMEAVGKISMLMDSEGVVQVKVNDGQFVEYEQLNFGYGRIRTGVMLPGSVADLSGRWAFVHDYGDSPLNPPDPDWDALLIPLVFDIEALPYPQFQSQAGESSSAVPQETPGLPNYVLFSVKDKAGNEVVQMKCHSVFDVQPEEEMVCDIFNEEMNSGDTLFEVTMSSLERIEFLWVGPVLSVPFERLPLVAVRID